MKRLHHGAIIPAQILISTALAISTFASPMSAYAEPCAISPEPVLTLYEATSPFSWYADTFSITSGTVRTPTRYFDGSNIGIEMESSAQSSGSLQVALYSSNGSSFGPRQIRYPGSSSASWLNTSPGYYYFRFSKRDNPSVTVTSNQLRMFSW